jgi:phage N-6-adenine-methyltransferase
MPAQKPGQSKQDYSTPRSFLDAVERRFGPVEIDLAAHAHNAVVTAYFNPEIDSLRQDWSELRGVCWLNPPFGRIGPWAEKCANTPVDSDRKILFLVPASVGANWYRDHVHDRALVVFLNGRLSFDGRNAFPKDCLLAIYGAPPGFEVWDWRAA